MRKIPSLTRLKKKRRFGCGGKCLSFFMALLLIILGSFFVQQSGLKEKILQTQYPLKYQEIVKEYATMYSLEEPLVFALIRTESKFDPYAVSKTKARGLMQIQSETAMDCAKELGWHDFSPDSLFAPKTNIQLGCYYFSKLLKRYKGKTDLAIAAYNGGPGNVDKWIHNNEYINDKGELIHIPFPETRNYLLRVKKAYDRYYSLYVTTTE